MRPLLAVAGLTVVLFTGAACSNGSEPAPASPAPSTAVASPVGAAVDAANTAQVCAAVKQLNTTTSRSLTATLKAPLDAAVAGASAKETTKAFEKAAKKMTADAGRWVAGLKEQSAAAKDPALSKAVSELATELTPLQTGRASLQQMNKIVQKSETDLAPYCGGAPAVTGSSSPTSAVAAGFGPGTACPGPVAFDTAEDWKPEPISEGTLKPGGPTMLCEIDAKPAGIIGFIRVWSVKADSQRAGLTDVVTALKNPTALKYRSITAGGQAALEVSYISSGSPGRAFAVTVPNGETVVADWKGLDQEEHQEGLPAYELARSSLTFP